MVYRFPKGSDIPVADHFKAREFDCPCPRCTVTLLDEDLAHGLETLRAIVGPIKINSGYRCEHHQQELRDRGYETAKGTSTHELGIAADIACEGKSGEELAKAAEQAGFLAIGVGKTWIHVDLRGKDLGTVRRWSYVKR